METQETQEKTHEKEVVMETHEKTHSHVSSEPPPPSEKTEETHEEEENEKTHEKTQEEKPWLVTQEMGPVLSQAVLDFGMKSIQHLTPGTPGTGVENCDQEVELFINEDDLWTDEHQREQTSSGHR